MKSTAGPLTRRKSLLEMPEFEGPSENLGPAPNVGETQIQVLDHFSTQQYLIPGYWVGLETRIQVLLGHISARQYLILLT